MSKLSHDEIIDELAISYGIEPEYTDNWGRIHQLSIETKKKILKAMGIMVDTPKQAKEAWRARLEHKGSCLTGPAIMVKLSDLPKEISLYSRHGGL